MNDPETRPLRPTDRGDFCIGIVCALTLELDAVIALFDGFWDSDGHAYGKAAGDPNNYTTGYIGRHNVVLTVLSRIGKARAASAAGSFSISFPKLRLVLLVGVCGAVPGLQGTDTEVSLGDVIISEGIVEYDFGRQFPGRFERKDGVLDVPGHPNAEICSVLAMLKGGQSRKTLMRMTAGHLKKLQKQSSLEAKYPGKDKDRLFEPSYQHIDPDQSCEECGCNGPIIPSRTLRREGNPLPTAHFGLIASSDTVMKSGEDRDAIAAQENVIAFEMEAAGLWDVFPCVVIKGVCDYADSHKSKFWQTYAAATAAACSKSFLEYWQSTPIAAPKTKNKFWVVPFQRHPKFVKRKALKLLPERPVKSASLSQTRMALLGLAGTGKSQIALEYAYRVHKMHPAISVFWVSGDTEKHFRESYQKIGLKCQIPGANGPDMLKIVRQWLESRGSGQWLMILDNADNLELYWEKTLAQYIPTYIHGSILFTTRNHRIAVQLGRGGIQIKVGTMTDTGAEKLLRRGLRNHREYQSTTLQELARKLGHLPLALTQATAFVEENNITVPELANLIKTDNHSFVMFLEARRDTTINPDRDIYITADRGSIPSRRGVGALRSVMDTLTETMDLIQRQDDWAARLLSLMAYFHRKGIPKVFLRNFFESSSEKNSSENLVLSLGVLRGFFVVAEAEDDTLSIPSLVQHAVFRWLRSQTAVPASESGYHISALRVISDVFPEPRTYKSWIQCREWLPHAQAVWQRQSPSRIASLTENLLTRLNLSLRLAHYFMAQGLHEKAENAVFRISKALVESSSFDYLLDDGSRLEEICIRKERGHVYHISHFRTLLQIYTNHLIRTNEWAKVEEKAKILMRPVKNWADSSYYILLGKTTLALAEMNKERWIEAENLLTEVVDMHKKETGIKHPATLNAMHQLARTLLSQGKFEDSGKWLKLCIKFSEQVLGGQHLLTTDAKGTNKLLDKEREKKRQEERNRSQEKRNGNQERKDQGQASEQQRGSQEKRKRKSGS